MSTRWALLLAAGLSLFVSDLARSGVFINEIDYDNDGLDMFEWIELAGPAGVSLDDYELVFIDQLGQVYNTLDLAAAQFTLADDTGSGWGFFVLGNVAPEVGGPADYQPSPWGTNEIQNGPRDSIQLRWKPGAVNVHLVDYEGDNESTSEDEVVHLADTNDDVDRSLYKTGEGTAFDDFTFTNEPGNSSPGALNEGQVLLASVSGLVDARIQVAGPHLASMPNPFRENTSITFETTRPSAVAVRIFDALGRRTRSWSGSWPAGKQRIEWGGRDDRGRRSAAGTYFAELVVNGQAVARRRIVLLR